MFSLVIKLHPSWSSSVDAVVEVNSIAPTPLTLNLTEIQTGGPSVQEWRGKLADLCTRLWTSNLDLFVSLLEPDSVLRRTAVFDRTSIKMLLVVIQSHVFDRHQQEESSFGPYNPRIKTIGGGTESETVVQRAQNHQSIQEQKQDFHIPQNYSAPEVRRASSQERSDPYAAVQSLGELNRYS